MKIFSRSNMRVGFHYFPDTEHYTQQDLYRWLPRLTALRTSWLTILAPLQHAVPEAFIRGLLDSGIQPILQFIPSQEHRVKSHELTPLLRAYASWGVKYIAFFDRPNTRNAWPSQSWGQTNLIERFLDRYIPIARSIVKFGLTPIFPPLQPGGEYWDTSFLRHALEALVRRKEEPILNRLVLGAYGYCRNSDWDWGAGGPERWPDTRPYTDAPDKPDHRGFHIFDWYSAIGEAVLGRPLPVFLLRAGNLNSPVIKENEERSSTDRFLSILRELANMPGAQDGPEIGEALMGSCFWLLSSVNTSRFSPAALFHEDGSPNPAGRLLLKFASVEQDQLSEIGLTPLKLSAFPIQQYVLLPKQTAQLPLQQVQSLAVGERFTYGTSLADATLAKKVIVLGGREAYPSVQLNHLEKAGCEIVTCQNTGIELAQILAAH